MGDIKVGVQLYTLRDLIRTYEDTNATFQFLKDLGCDVVQISGIGPLTPEEKAELVDKYGFDVCVTHTGFDRMRTDVDAVIDEHKMIHCDCLGVGSMPGEFRNDLDGVRKFVEEANRVGARMKERGCRFAYHNHAFEYEKIDGDRTIMDILLEETDPETFFFVPDIAWMHIAGMDPVECLTRMKGRVKVAHFKDYKITDDERSFTELGNGLMDLEGIWQACVDLGIPYVVYEQDSGFDDPKVSTEISFNYLKKLAGK
ncbi:MAG: sugar phosphate isomerase/epimerase [Oscillospiraceae bacterium]|jgi:sugar phosphate isomerase/epimerase|nr:sugar phosphate isomerase/epimerase [Oscillospiraceae bacterium]